MSFTRRLTLPHLSPRRLLLTAGLAVTCLTASAAPAFAYPAHTVLNYCSNHAGLGRVTYGKAYGLEYIAFDSNWDGTTDHIDIDTNGDHYVNITFADTNEDGTPDWVGLCNGRPQLWYRWSYIQSRIQQQAQQGSDTFTVSGVPSGLTNALNTPYNSASNQVWSEIGPGMSGVILSGDPYRVPIEAY
jgi:hypothetical protein